MSNYTYTIFDADPNSSSGTEWPSHQDVELEANDDDEALTYVLGKMATEATGLSVSDDYAVGDTIHAIVWSEDGTIVGHPTYELTNEDLGVPTDEERSTERLARAAKHIDATDIGDGKWAHYADETSRWYVVTAAELEELCDYLEHESLTIRADAYSHWCAGTNSEEMPAGWNPHVTAETVAELIKDVRFVTPPENQGQIVLVSYGCDGDYIYEHVYDQSDRSTTVRVYEHPENDEEWGPQNGAPNLGEQVYSFELDD